MIGVVVLDEMDFSLVVFLVFCIHVLHHLYCEKWCVSYFWCLDYETIAYTLFADSCSTTAVSSEFFFRREMFLYISIPNPLSLFSSIFKLSSNIDTLG